MRANKSSIVVFLCVFLLGASSVYSAETEIIRHQRGIDSEGLLTLDESLRPFYHGVASGDPLPNSVIIWTRVTPQEEGNISGRWFVSTDPNGSSFFKMGTFSTDASRDYTVKVEVDSLEPSTTYYYWFQALEATSLIGRMRTAPVESSHIRFAVISCNSFPHGFFNGFARVAERNDLDAVLHLGDYIYEYGNSDGEYGAATGSLLGRLSEPPSETIKLADYRTRYAQYRLDPDLRAAHQQQTFITIWDDHEFANNAYAEGAQNHTEGVEGAWSDRKSAAQQAYFEWLPVRESPAQSIYRKFTFGNMVDLIMLDTRIEGRDRQAEGISDPTLNSPDRTMLGQEQFDWFTETIRTSTAQWKIVGNQVIFAPIVADVLGPQIAGAFLDVWNGYPAERRRILDVIKDNSIDNVVMLTGDFHIALALDIPDNVAAYRASNNSLAVEFASPSITSANFDESSEAVARATVLADPNIPEHLKEDPRTLDSLVKDQVQQQLSLINGGLRFLNPHLQEMNLTEHGYFVLDVTPERVQGDFFFVDSILVPTSGEKFAFAFSSSNGANRLTPITSPAPLKAEQALPAAARPREGLSVTEKIISPVLLNFYPNPTAELSYCTFSVKQDNTPVSLALYDVNGGVVKEIAPSQYMKGVYTVVFDFENIASGTYYLQLRQGEHSTSRVVVVTK